MSKSRFDALLDQVGVLAKSFPPAEGAEGDAKIAAAAAEGEGAEGAEGDGKKPELDAEGKPMAKSFVIQVQSENGAVQEVDAIDGTELVKALSEQLVVLEDRTAGALETVLAVVARQGEMIKAQADKIATFGGQGVGRRTLLTIAERPAPKADLLAKGGDAGGGDGGGAASGMNPSMFLEKCLSLQGKGLTSHDIATAEAAINGGRQPPEHIVRVVAAAG